MLKIRADFAEYFTALRQVQRNYKHRLAQLPKPSPGLSALIISGIRDWKRRFASLLVVISCDLALSGSPSIVPGARRAD